MIICSYAIKLGGWLVVVGGPVFTAIKGYLRATIIANDHAVGVFWRYPQIVMVAMWGISAFKGHAAIRAGLVAYIHHIDFVGVFGIGINARVIP